MRDRDATIGAVSILQHRFGRPDAELARGGFSFFRLLLFHAYRDNLVWFGAWEEATELLFIAGVAVVMRVFRDALWGAPANSPGPQRRAARRLFRP